MVRETKTVRTSVRRFGLSLVMPAFLIVSVAVYGADPVPERSESMQTLVVPEAQLDLGEVYHVFCGQDT